jgi:hypothetical protein
VAETFTEYTLENATQILDERVWTFRRVGGLSTGVNTLQNNLLTATTAVQTVSSVPASTLPDPSGKNGIPDSLLSVSAVESPSKQQDRTFSEVSVSFTRDGTDTSFAGVRIWFTGYQGSVSPVLMSSGTTSPITFLCESTGEVVVVSAQPVSSSGLTADLAFARTTTVALDGVVSQPPAPNASPSLISTPTGYQFAFDFLTGLLEDVISVYRVYRNTSNTTVGATVIQTVPQDVNSASSSFVVQDVIGSQDTATYYYWVSAVDTMGIESVLTPAQSGAVVQGSYLIPPNYAGGISLAENGNFEASALMMNGAPPGWQALGATLSYETVSPQSGSQSLIVNASVQFGNANAVRLYQVKPGDAFRVSGYIKQASNVSPAISLLFLDASGAQLGGINASVTATGAWTGTQGTGVAPAGTVSARLYCIIAGTSGGIATFDGVFCCRQLTAFELTPVSTSGTPTVNTPICTQSGTSKTINVAASTFQFGDGQVSYNSGSVTPGAYGTFYIYADDPAYAGGAVTYVATTNAPDVNANNGRLFFGKITTAGGGGGTSTGAGSGGGGATGKGNMGF